VRAILDGHIVLSRKLAGANHYPAIDVLASISRVMPNIVSAEHRNTAARWRALMSRYQELELLIQIGEYRPGADPLADEAVRLRPAMQQFLAQSPQVHQGFDGIVSELQRLADGESGDENEDPS
jgi:type III secretion protein N (ATPase)